MALSFNGSSQRADLGAWDDIEGLSQFTLCAFVTVHTLGNFREIIGNNHASNIGYAMSLAGTSGGSDDVSLYCRNGSTRYAYTSGNIISAGVRNHWLMQFDGAQAESARLAFWLNGVSQPVSMANAGSTVTTVPTSSANTSLGCFMPSSLFTHCTVAEVAVWSSTLTAGEITSLARGVSPLEVRPVSLRHYYPLYGRTSPEPDLVGGDSATLVGSPAAADHPPMHEELPC